MVALARPNDQQNQVKAHKIIVFKKKQGTPCDGHQTNIYINIIQTTADVNISERLSALNVLTRKQFVAAKRLQLAK